MVIIDDSFTKQGTVPFKWEIRPGVPKIQHQQQSSDHNRRFIHYHHKPLSEDLSRSSSTTPQKLKPPPAKFYLDTGSFRSTPRTHLGRPDIVSPGCFSSPLLKPRANKKGSSSRWLKSTRSKSTPQSPLPLFDLTSHSSFSSDRSSARPVSDVEWAAFGLF